MESILSLIQRNLYLMQIAQVPKTLEMFSDFFFSSSSAQLTNGARTGGSPQLKTGEQKEQ